MVEFKVRAIARTDVGTLVQASFYSGELDAEGAFVRTSRITARELSLSQDATDLEIDEALARMADSLTNEDLIPEQAALLDAA